MAVVTRIIGNDNAFAPDRLILVEGWLWLYPGDWFAYPSDHVEMKEFDTSGRHLASTLMFDNVSLITWAPGVHPQLPPVPIVDIARRVLMKLTQEQRDKLDPMAAAQRDQLLDIARGLERVIEDMQGTIDRYEKMVRDMLDRRNE